MRDGGISSCQLEIVLACWYSVESLPLAGTTTESPANTNTGYKPIVPFLIACPFRERKKGPCLQGAPRPMERSGDGGCEDFLFRINTGKNAVLPGRCVGFVLTVLALDVGLDIAF